MNPEIRDFIARSDYYQGAVRELAGLLPAEDAALDELIADNTKAPWEPGTTPRISALKEEVAAGDALSSPAAVRDFLRLALAALPHEAFMVLFLDSQHRLVAADELFRGTLAQTSVYPREVVKAALACNAAADCPGSDNADITRAPPPSKPTAGFSSP